MDEGSTDSEDTEEESSDDEVEDLTVDDELEDDTSEDGTVDIDWDFKVSFFLSCDFFPNVPFFLVQQQQK